MQNSTPDPYALEIAQAIQQATNPNTVVLFGSRATGYHRDDSDVDILIIGAKPQLSATAGYLAAKAYMSANPPQLELDIVTMTTAEFQRCRKAKQHLAGQADHHGVNMSGERLNYSTDYDDEYPDHWPATKQRLENTAECRKEFNDMMDEDHWNQKTIGFYAQRTVENALRGLLSAHNDPAIFRHNINRIWDHYIDHHHTVNDPTTDPLNEAVTELLRHTTYEDLDNPGEYRSWLSEYAANYRYNKTPRTMSRAEKLELQELLDTAVGHLVNRIHELSGTSDADLFLDGVPWEPQTPS